LQQEIDPKMKRLFEEKFQAEKRKAEAEARQAECAASSAKRMAIMKEEMGRIGLEMERRRAVGITAPMTHEELENLKREVAQNFQNY
jgi:multidrug resistance efflux pump